jgi:hypothetical protein
MARISQISSYFNTLVDLIPAHHYLDAEEAITLRFMKKGERASTKAAFKKQHRQTKRAKLDPDANTNTTDVQQDRNAGRNASTSSAQEHAPLRAHVFTTASAAPLLAGHVHVVGRLSRLSQ